MQMATRQLMGRVWVFALLGIAAVPAWCRGDGAALANGPVATTHPATQAASEVQRLRDGWLLQDDAVVGASGDIVSRRTFDTRGWHRAVVPGTVLTSLVADGTYPDPLYGLNNLAIPDALFV